MVLLSCLLYGLQFDCMCWWNPAGDTSWDVSVYWYPLSGTKIYDHIFPSLFCFLLEDAKLMPIALGKVQYFVRGGCKKGKAILAFQYVICDKDLWHVLLDLQLCFGCQ